MICLYCHAGVEEEADLISLFRAARPLCNECREKLSAWREGERCSFCHRLLEHAEEACPDCLFLSRNYRRPGKIMCMLDYSGEVKMLFHRYKFTKDVALREVISMFLNCRFREYDMSIPIPVSAERLRERGYNQTSMVLESARVPYHDVLVTDRRGRQSELAKSERMNASNPFGFKPGFDAGTLRGKRLLVVDDIYTTGITMHQALETLHTGNPAVIDMLTFSKA